MSKEGLPNLDSVKENGKYYGAILVGVATVGFLASRYKIAKPNEYLIRTGLGIKDINITKKGVQWPFQRLSRLDMTPKNYKFHLDAMSTEKMEFILPGVFTIGPLNDGNSLQLYARLLLGEEESSVGELIRGVIEGETRILASSMTMENIFQDRKIFKENVIEKMELELNQFGLKIYNANIKEIKDAEGSEYFSQLRLKTREGVANQAKIDVAEAKFRGDVGAKEKEKETRISVANFEMEAILMENQRSQEILQSNNELNIKDALYKKETNIARIEADKFAKMREVELQKDVEIKKQQQEIESLKASEYSAAVVKALSRAKEAEGLRDAMLLEADAKLYAKEKEAMGVRALYDAQSTGMKQLVDTFDGDNHSLIHYLMIEHGLYTKLADSNAKAIQGLNPKITIWNTNSGSGDGNKTTDTIRDIAQFVPPLMDSIEKQTGYKIPSWLLERNQVNETNVEDLSKQDEKKSKNNK